MASNTNFIEALRKGCGQKEQFEALTRDIQDIVFGGYDHEEPSAEVIQEVLRWERGRNLGLDLDDGG